MPTEINIKDIEKYIGKIIWFEEEGKKSKPRKLNSIRNGTPFSFDENNGSAYYLSLSKESFTTVKIFTYAD